MKFIEFENVETKIESFYISNRKRILTLIAVLTFVFCAFGYFYIAETIKLDRLAEISNEISASQDSVRNAVYAKYGATESLLTIENIVSIETSILAQTPKIKLLEKERAKLENAPPNIIVALLLLIGLWLLSPTLTELMQFLMSKINFTKAELMPYSVGVFSAIIRALILGFTILISVWYATWAKSLQL